MVPRGIPNLEKDFLKVRYFMVIEQYVKTYQVFNWLLLPLKP